MISSGINARRRRSIGLLQLLYLYDLSPSEVAAVIGSSAGAVRTAAWRARQLLRKEIEGVDE